ncbi:MAG: hypothetical protein UY00_C0045G0016 [Candidatus Wolfebacteria bacterium GW2011_GWA1_47_6]|nr:MAG: hypothetical protein UY00_C0045G0016 [Candidatus Wolfebacteria bacterium GW2011_GWA1_47_6]
MHNAEEMMGELPGELGNLFGDQGDYEEYVEDGDPDRPNHEGDRME